MTVNYASRIATTSVWAFGRLLFGWKGSVYKLVWLELVLFLFLYVFVTVIYHSALDCEQQKNFESWVRYCREYAEVIPVLFLVSAFVKYVLNRWWRTFQTIRSPDKACFCVNMAVPSDEPEMLQYRRAIARYLNLAQLLVLRDVSASVKKRFPTLDKVVLGGFMMPREKDMLDELKGGLRSLDKHHKYWLVVHWATDVLCKIHDRKCIRDERLFKLAYDEVLAFRNGLESLLGFDWVPVPLSYTQLVALAVYAYFVIVAIADQQLIEDKQYCTPGGGEFEFRIGQFIPIFPAIGFAFVMGWLKVAESIINPFGRDDDDFEMNYIINRNLAVSYAIVDTHRSTCPIIKDEIAPSIPESGLKSKQQKGSAANYQPSTKDKGPKSKLKC